MKNKTAKVRPFFSQTGFAAFDGQVLLIAAADRPNRRSIQKDDLMAADTARRRTFSLDNSQENSRAPAFKFSYNAVYIRSIMITCKVVKYRPLQALGGPAGYRADPVWQSATKYRASPETGGDNGI